MYSKILDTLTKTAASHALDPREIKGKFIQDLMVREHGRTISTSAASRAKRQLIQFLYGRIDVSFEKLESYFTAVKVANPNTYAEVEKCDGYFYRSIFVPSFCIRAVKYCQNVLAIDGDTEFVGS